MSFGTWIARVAGDDNGRRDHEVGAEVAPCVAGDGVGDFADEVAQIDWFSDELCMICGSSFADVMSDSHDFGAGACRVVQP